MDIDFGYDEFVVLTKSNCRFCLKVKELLKDKSVNIIICDKFLVDKRDEFLNYIKDLIGYEYKLFPMVFRNKKFIGGYSETYQIISDEDF